MLLLVSDVYGSNPLEQAIRLFEDGNYTQAGYVLKKLLIDNPGDSEALYYLGRIRFVQGDYGQAVEWLEKAAAYREDHPEYFNQLALAYGERAKKAGLLGKVLYARKMKGAALRAVHLDPEYVPARFTLFQYFCYAPGLLGGSKEKARIQAEEIMARDPLLGHLAWAEIHTQQKAYEKAHASYLDLLELARAQNHPSISKQKIEARINFLGYLLSNRGDHLKAIEVLETNTIEFPDSANAWYSLALAHEKKGDEERAGAFYEKSLAVNPRNSIHSNGLYKSARRGLNRLRPAAEQREYTYRTPVDDGGWSTASLVDVGIRIEPLIALMNDLGNQYEGYLHSILIVRNGQLVFEEYFDGADLVVDEETLQSTASGAELLLEECQFDRNALHFQASVTKSITSALVGIAIDRGWIKGVQEKMFSFFPEYAGLATERKNDITIEHLLTMTSGIPWDDESHPYSDDRNSVNQLLEADDPIGYVLGLDPVASPGREYCYNSGTTILLGEILRRASGMPVADFAEEFLFTPLGISSFQMVNLPDAKETFFASSGLFLRPRDMAKLGQLYLQKGRWNSKQVISQQWVEETLKPHVSLPKPKGSSSTLSQFTSHYGFQWRLGRFKKSNTGGFLASGLGGQYIFVLPKMELVVVFTGGDYGAQQSSAVYEIMEDYILPAAN